MNTSLPSAVTLFEMGPRDGLQNESKPVSSADKIELVNRLSAAGFSKIETGSFVSPKWVPQMAGSDTVFAGIERRPGVSYTALTPNLKGFQAALAAGVNEVAVFAAASEAFSQKNINCSIAESIERFRPIMHEAARHRIPVRGYVSCVVGCPYQGSVAPETVANIAQQLLAMGCYQVSLGDTIGVGTPAAISHLLETVTQQIAVELLAIHCHDTYGQALANIYAALQAGVATIDSAVAGLGGCPYAKGASGNVATEDVLYLLQGMGITTHIDLEQTVAAGQFICQRLGRANQSRAANALLANR